MFAWPLGRCFSISPTSFPGNMIIGGSTLFLHFIETALKDVHIRLYFMDKTSSLKIYPDQNDMAGDPLKVQFDNYIHRYKTRISRSQYVQGDPLIDCAKYTSDNNYNECVQSELFGSFENLLGCQPPLLAQNPEKMCNERFNRSADNEKEVQEMFRELNFHDNSFNVNGQKTKG